MLDLQIYEWCGFTMQTIMSHENKNSSGCIDLYRDKSMKFYTSESFPLYGI